MLKETLEKVCRVVLAYKRRVVRKIKKRSPVARFKSRQYYRKHKAILKVQQRRYIKRNKVFLKSRKLFKRTKPHWMSKKKQKHAPKPHYKKYRSPKPKVKKFHAPKRAKKVKKP